MPFIPLEEIEHCAVILSVFPDVKYRGVGTSGWVQQGVPSGAGQYNDRMKNFFPSHPELSVVAF